VSDVCANCCFYAHAGNLAQLIKAAAVQPAQPVDKIKAVPGNRHDNDHQHYRDILVLPTASELACTVEGYLPLADGSNKFLWPQAHFGIADRAAVEAQRTLDSVFRLLREDMLQPMRQALRQYQQSVYSKQLRLGHARIVDIKCEQQTGGCAHAVIEFEWRSELDKTFWKDKNL
jgi:hypothetical protein